MTAAIVGVDVGGTTTAAGVVTRDGDVVVDESAPTRGKAPADPLAAISALIRKVSDEAARRPRSIDAIGVGVPGPVDAARGRVGEPVIHVPELEGRPLADELTAEFGLQMIDATGDIMSQQKIVRRMARTMLHGYDGPRERRNSDGAS